MERLGARAVNFDKDGKRYIPEEVVEERGLGAFIEGDTLETEDATRLSGRWHRTDYLNQGRPVHHVNIEGVMNLERRYFGEALPLPVFPGLDIEDE